MKTKSKTTKKYQAGYIILSILAFLAFFGPAAFFVISAFITSGIVAEKVAITTAVLIVLIMTAFAIINKMAMRSRLWILAIALCMVLPDITPVIIAIGVGQIAYEILIEPIRKYLKERYVINKEIDKRNEN